MKNLNLPIILIVISQFLLASCDDIRDIFKPKDDPTEVENYAPKNIKGKIELPSRSDIDLSGCEILSIYGEADITGSQFNLDIESAIGQQMIYFTDEFGNILMLNFANDEKSLTINAQTTSVALIMLLLQASGVDQKGWNEITAEVLKNKNFPYLQKEVEDLIKSRKDILSEDNTDLMTLCGALVDDLITENKSALKSIKLDDELAPLVVTQSGTNLSITNNGRSPAYQISVSKDGKVLEKKSLNASVMADVSAGSILTWTWGLYKAPDPISFILDKAGDYEIRASSTDTKDGFDSPAFLNTLDVTKNLITVLGMKLPKTCLVEGVKSYYNLVPAQIIELKKKPILSNLDLAQWWITSFCKLSLNAIKATVLCGGSTDQSSSYGTIEKYLNYAAKGGEWLLKSFDFVSKGGAIVNLGTQVSFWVYQGKEILFCMRNENNELVKCPEVEVPLKDIAIVIYSNENLYKTTRLATPDPGMNGSEWAGYDPCNLENSYSYSTSAFFLGNDNNWEILSYVISRDNFSIESYNDYKDEKLSISGEIVNKVIKSINYRSSRISKDSENGINWTNERISTLYLSNLEIPFKSIQSKMIFSNPTNNISYTFTIDDIKTHDLTYQVDEFGKCKMLRTGNYVEHLYETSTQLFPSNVEFEFRFPGAPKPI